MHRIYVQTLCHHASYTRTPPFNPGTAYPEYLWRGDLSKCEENYVYDAVRALFCSMSLDSQHFGASDWNPLGKLIQPGMTVLLKPNMVLHRNLNSGATGLDEVITNPGLVRAVCDYVCIALKGTGKIIIGDAPLQSCDFRSLCHAGGYDDIVAFFQKKGVHVELMDFRQIVSTYNEDRILETVDQGGDPAGYECVSLGDYSCHKEKRHFRDRFRVTGYDYRKMAQYHTATDNKYLISRSALSADVIISLPKLKTHRKAGITASLKNFIGIVGHKDCLPHHTKGSVDDGGDEYLASNVWKRLAVLGEEKLNMAAIQGKKRVASLLLCVIRKLWKLANRTATDPYSEGSWYGNDTIWRTTLDLVRIAYYADKTGLVQQRRQRAIFAVVDAVVAGEGEGPLNARAKHSSIIAASEDLPGLDATLTALMGFNPADIPTVKNSFAEHPLPLTRHAMQDIKIVSNYESWNISSIFALEQHCSFIPPNAWKEYLIKNA